LIVSAFAIVSATAQDIQPIPDDFPRFIVPGHQDKMDSLRAMFWLHYPGAGPKATLWDEWLSTPSLWPAVDSDDRSNRFRLEWARALASRDMDAKGYVATHQHASIAHQQGWPFPFWKQGGPNTWGWHFSLAGVPNGWHGTEVKDQRTWTLSGGVDEGIHDDAWWIRLDQPHASVTTPPLHIDVFQSPFIQIRWKTKGLSEASPYVEWTAEDTPEFDRSRRVSLEPVAEDRFTYSMIPLYRHPEWKGIVTRLRIGFGNSDSGGEVGVHAMFTQYDTRHNINNSNFVRGCSNYFMWTGDVEFLRGQIARMRRAILFVMDEFHAREEGVVLTDWVGHGGRSGIQRAKDGTKTLIYGRGVGNNYWDLLPFGHKDSYATVQHYDALQQMIVIERAIEAHPEWSVPDNESPLDADALAKHASQVKRSGNKQFWNSETQRFTAGVDLDGVSHDYGFTFLNLEAVYYDFATPDHAQAIYDWIGGDRAVDGDTSTGPDIYHWQFGPRATTKRNTDYYGWFWSNPESIVWGGQVQDGGAVLGFSFHDLMARLKTRGPDDAWQRLQEVIAWFDEVQAAGGYRAYYDGSRDGTLQGGGTAGGLGCDKEFFESVLVPQIVIEGFLGFTPTADGFRLDPKLPGDWPELTVSSIRLQDAVFDIGVSNDRIDITMLTPGSRSIDVSLPTGTWLKDDAPFVGSVSLTPHQHGIVTLIRRR
jgi:hypothetical protein